MIRNTAQQKLSSIGYLKYLIMPSILLVLVVFIAVSVSAMGARLVSLEEEKQKLEHENRLITAELVEYSSLSRLEEKAKEMGLAEAPTIVYLNNGEAVAKLP